MRHSMLALSSCLLAACSGSTATAPPPAAPPAEKPAPAAESARSGALAIVRLDADVKPQVERVELTVNPDREDFSGRVEIDLVLGTPRSDLVISARQLAIGEGTLTAGGQKLTVAATPDDAHGVARLKLSGTAPAGPATLSLSFTAKFNANLVGLYRVKSGDRWYAFTQFEAVDARRAFPCFDEPAMKIPWELTLVIPSGEIAVANTPESERGAAGPMTRVRFKRTRALPSYLVAIAVGDFDIVAPPPLPPNEIRKRPLQVRGIAVKGRGGELAWSLDAGAEMLVMLERWFGSEFPYEKLDHIAVPDYAYGAMENAGLITYREQTLLVDPAKAAEAQKLSVAVDLAHEMAHQWFGDLVTMAWWDDLWLNESFASFMETMITAEWAKGSRYDLQQLRAVQNAMLVDELSSVNPIRVEKSTEDQIFGFDYAITYPKGNQVIAMFEQYLGPDRFQAGIRRYLAKHADANATMDDLMASLSEGGADLTPTLRSFVQQPGLPLVRADLRCDGGKPRVELAQSRQLPVGSTASADVRWSIPVCVKTDGSDSADCTLLSGATGELPLPRKTCPAWVAPNPNAKGYYRWALPPEQLRALLGKGYSKLSPNERLSLGSNLSAGFRSNSLAAADVLPALAPLAADPEPAVAEEPADMLRFVRANVVDAKDRPAVEAYVRKLYRPALDKLGWKARPKEPARISTFRAWLVNELIETGRDKEVLEKAAQLGRAYLGNDGHLHLDAVDPNLAAVAVAAAARTGNAQTFDTIFERLLSAEDLNIREYLLGGLGSFDDPALAEKARNLAFDDRLRVNERAGVLFAQAGRLETADTAWKWIEDNFDRFSRRIPEAYIGFITFLHRGCGDAAAQHLEDTLGKPMKEVQGGTYNLNKAIEATRLCGARVEAQKASTAAYFAGQRSR